MNQTAASPCALMENNAPESSEGKAALHSLLLDQLPVGVFQKDREGRFVFVNSWFCRFKKAPAEQFLGRTAGEIAAAFPAPEGMGPAEQLHRDSLLIQGEHHHALIIKTGQPIEADERYVEEDGRERYLHAIKGPLFDADGSVIGTQGLLLDITERKRAEAQLANERDLLGALLNCSPDAIYFKDLESRFVRCSAAMAPLCKLKSADEMIGRCDADFCLEEHARLALEDEQEIIRSGKPLIGKSEKETWADGSVTWALTSKMPLFDSRGEIIGTFGISKDITAFKETEIKLEELHKQLLQTSRQAGMTEVATSVLHNVGNVLNSANISTALLLDNAQKSSAHYLGKAAALLNEHSGNLGEYLTNDAKGRQLPLYLTRLSERLAEEQQSAIKELESLRQNIEHIKEIVAMQQSYAKVSGVVEKVRPADLIEDALRMSAGALVRHEVAVERDFGFAPELTVEKHKVLQILVNLIRNAKYACDDAGRHDKQVRLQLSYAEPWVRIVVSDNGVGIAPENLTRIFNHGFTTRKDGHGFGLHSGALAARQLGGALSGHSEGPGKGASFTLLLPAQPPDNGSLELQD
ncbi:MAG TPA: PAS domain-containing sensor histidine kinase [Verrucomicrobiae bacterium]|jgi:PAS domain S-box-containing protein